MVDGNTATTKFASGLSATLSFADGPQGGFQKLTASTNIGNAYGPSGNRAGLQIASHSERTATDTAYDIGKMTIEFSRPVTNPHLDLRTPMNLIFNADSIDPTKYTNTVTELNFSLNDGSSDVTFMPVGSVFANTYHVSADGKTATGTGSPTSLVMATLELHGTFSSVTIDISKRYRITGSSDHPDDTTQTNPRYYPLNPLTSSFAVTVDEDFGQASTSYGNASHVIGGLYLGRSATVANSNGLSTTAGRNSGDVNDAVTAWPALKTSARGSLYSVDVPITNPGDAAVLAGWVDFNGNGAFDDGEKATAAIDPSAGASTARLTWTVPADTRAGATWTRLRLMAGDTPATAEGMADSGEVEDSSITIIGNIANLSITKSGGASVQLGGQATWTIGVTNGTTDDTPPTDTAVSGAVMSDHVPDEFTGVSWTCQVLAGGTCVDASGAGNVIEARSNLAIGGAVRYTVTGTLSAMPARATFANTARVELPTGIVDPNGPRESTATGVTPTLQIAKKADEETTAPGEVVEYTLTVHNPSTFDYAGAHVTDDLSGVLDDADFVGSASASSGTVTYSAPELAWTGDVPAGATTTIEYRVKVRTDARGDHLLINRAYGQGPDSSCTVLDPCTTTTAAEIPDPALTIRKVIDNSRPTPGDTVTYTVTVTNPVTVDYRGAAYLDDLSSVLDDADLVGVPTTDLGTVTVTDGVLTWTGDVPAGRTATTTYQVKIRPDGRGDHQLVNIVVAQTPGTNCPEGSTDPQCATRTIADVPGPALAVSKATDHARPAPGDQVGYTITLANPTSADYPDAKVIDDLSDVLGVADLVDGSLTATAGEATIAGSVITCNGNVPGGNAVTITYAVTVRGDATAEDQLMNTVIVNGPHTNCPAQSTDPTCTTNTPVDADNPSAPPSHPLRLAFTGAGLAGVTTLAAALMLAGALLLRRRRGKDS